MKKHSLLSQRKQIGKREDVKLGGHRRNSRTRQEENWITGEKPQRMSAIEDKCRCTLGESASHSHYSDEDKQSHHGSNDLCQSRSSNLWKVKTGEAGGDGGLWQRLGWQVGGNVTRGLWPQQQAGATEEPGAVPALVRDVVLTAESFNLNRDSSPCGWLCSPLCMRVRVCMWRRLRQWQEMLLLIQPPDDSTPRAAVSVLPSRARSTQAECAPWLTPAAAFLSVISDEDFNIFNKPRALHGVTISDLCHLKHRVVGKFHLSLPDSSAMEPTLEVVGIIFPIIPFFPPHIRIKTPKQSCFQS